MRKVRFHGQPIAGKIKGLCIADHTPQKYGDYLTFFGEYEGLYRYTNLLGNNKSIPEITAHHFYEIDGAKTHPSESLIKDIKQAIAVHEELYGFPLPASPFRLTASTVCPTVLPNWKTKY